MPRHLSDYLFFGLAYAFIAFAALFARPHAAQVASAGPEAGAAMAGSMQSKTVAGVAEDRNRR